MKLRKTLTKFTMASNSETTKRILPVQTALQVHYQTRAIALPQPQNSVRGYHRELQGSITFYCASDQ